MTGADPARAGGEPTFDDAGRRRMTDRDAEGTCGFERAHRAQKRRVLAALLETESLDATPAVRDDEVTTGEEYETLVYELQNRLLPELAAAGFVEFDRQVERVTRGPRFDEARAALEDGRLGDLEPAGRADSASPSPAE